MREIASRGHEVASHGNDHHLCMSQSPKELLQDIIVGRQLLEDITGQGVLGYRAPSFSVDDSILKTIRKAGYKYDSSYNSFSMHGRYGRVDLSKATGAGVAYEISRDFFEIPISNFYVSDIVLPLGGGGYFRLIPFPVFRHGIISVLKKQDAFVFYAHPWEFDPDQPRVEQASSGFKFRHYINLNLTEKKLTAMIRAFSNLDFNSCANYLNLH